MSSNTAHQLRLTWLQWQGLTRALPQWLLQQSVASQAEAAVGAGVESPYQVRVCACVSVCMHLYVRACAYV